MDYVLSSRDEIKKYTSQVYSKGYVKGLSTGMKELDYHYTFRKGELDVIMGIANIGKTTTMFYLMMTASIKYGWKWACYCPENEPVGDMITDIAEMYAGRTADKDNPSRMTLTTFNNAIDWVLDHFTVVTFNSSPTAGEVLDAFEDLALSGDYDGFLLDPLNDLKLDSKFQSKYDYYYSSLSDIRRFKQRFNVKFIVTTHAGTVAARRRDDDNKIPAPSMYDVEFGGMFANRTDNFIVIHRHAGDAYCWDITEIHVRKIKFQKLVGLPTQEDMPVKLKFDPSICRFKAFDSYSKLYVDPLVEEQSEIPRMEELEF
jgi:hypothetical protein